MHGFDLPDSIRSRVPWLISDILSPVRPSTFFQGTEPYF